MRTPEIIPLGRFLIGVAGLAFFFTAMLFLLAYGPEVDAAVQSWKGSF